MRWRGVGLVATAVVVAAMVLAFAALSWINRGSAVEEAARVDALAVGPALVESLLSYDAPTVVADLGAAAELTTGDFRDRFTDYAANTVAPQSQARGLSTRARVVEVGFLGGTGDHVLLLMFVDQITTSIAQPAPSATTSRVEVALDHVDGRWRIGDLTPV